MIMWAPSRDKLLSSSKAIYGSNRTKRTIYRWSCTTCDAAALPQAVVDSLRVEAEREGGDAMCQVILRHRDEEQLGQLYQQLVSRDIGDDSLHASEATRDFMSRLRISIMVNTSVPAMTADGPPLDIVFCHDVISRAATLGWVEVGRVVRPAEQIDPGQWSRRRPIKRGDRDAVVYLSCPAQPTSGWDYLDALASLFQPGAARKARQGGETLVPARQTTVQDPATRQILEETHRLGSWVVNFDDLLDRRQLPSTATSESSATSMPVRTAGA